LLAELRALARLQAAQAEAIASRDWERAGVLHAERARLQGELGARPEPTAEPELGEARRIASELLARDREIERSLLGARDEVGRELSGLASGRDLLGGYRPQRATSMRYLDRAG